MPFRNTALSAANVLKERRKASASVVEAKSKLQQAIADKNVDKVKLALLFLSTTKLASSKKKTAIRKQRRNKFYACIGVQTKASGTIPNAPPLLRGASMVLSLMQYLKSIRRPWTTVSFS